MVRHSLNFWTLLLVFNEYVTRQFKMCCRGEKGTFSHFNEILESIYVSWQNSLSISMLPYSNAWFVRFATEKGNLTVLLNLRSLSFIANRSLFFITQYWFMLWRRWIGVHVERAIEAGNSEDTVRTGINNRAKSSKMSHDMTKPTKWVCAQRRLRSAWTQCFFTQWTAKTDQTGRMPRLIWVFAGRTVTLLVLS